MALQQLQRTDLAEDLGELKSALTSGSADGSSLAQILCAFGEDTTEAATTASGEVAAKVQQLGHKCLIKHRNPRYTFEVLF